MIVVDTSVWIDYVNGVDSPDLGPPAVRAVRAVRAADNYRLLRSRGSTIRMTIDVLIGTFCIEESHQLLFSDRDFGPLNDHLGLQAA